MTTDRFQRLTDACFRSFGRNAVYVPTSGAAVPLVWSFWERPTGTRLNDLRSPHFGPIAHVKLSDIPAQPDTSDQFTMGTRTFTVKKSELDAGGTFWILELAE